MGVLRVRYLRIKHYKGKTSYFWQPKKGYIVQGKYRLIPESLEAKALGNDEKGAYEEAKTLYELLQKWREGDQVKPKAEKGTVDWLIAEYKKDQRFKSLRESTQKLYLYTLPELSRIFGDIPFDKVTRAQVREFYNSFSHTSRKASQVMQISRTVFAFAEDMEWIEKNPFAKQNVKKPKPRRVIVSRDDIENAKAKAIEMGLRSIAYAIQIAFDAGQRPGDIRCLTRNDYDGKWLTIVQSKTGATAQIPVYRYPVLKDMLDNLNHDSLLILHEERTGKPYSKDMLCRRVREVFDAAGVSKGMQFRDLRRTAFVRMIESGSTVPQACAITGHSIEEGNDIVKVYCPFTQGMADGAAGKVQKLEKRKLPKK